MNNMITGWLKASSLYVILLLGKKSSSTNNLSRFECLKDGIILLSAARIQLVIPKRENVMIKKDERTFKEKEIQDRKRR